MKLFICAAPATLESARNRLLAQTGAFATINERGGAECEMSGLARLLAVTGVVTIMPIVCWAVLFTSAPPLPIAYPGGMVPNARPAYNRTPTWNRPGII